MTSLKKTVDDLLNLVGSSHDQWFQSMVTLVGDLIEPQRVFGGFNWQHIPHALILLLINVFAVLFQTLHLITACLLVFVVAPVFFAIALVWIGGRRLFKELTQSSAVK